MKANWWLLERLYSDRVVKISNRLHMKGVILDMYEGRVIKLNYMDVYREPILLRGYQLARWQIGRHRRVWNS